MATIAMLSLHDIDFTLITVIDVNVFAFCLIFPHK